MVAQSHQQTRLDIVLGHVIGSAYTRERERMDKIEREEKMVAFKVWADSVKWEPATKRTKLIGLNERLSR